MSIPLRNPEEIESIAGAGRVVWGVLGELLDACAPGVTILELCEIASRLLRDRGAEALTRGLVGDGPVPFAGVCCVNINEIAAHQFPSDRAIRSGDLVSVDLSASLDGWCADACRSVVVGGADQESARLCEGAIACLETGIRACRPGGMWSEVSSGVLAAARDLGLTIVTGLGGHGIGRSLHESPLAWLDPPGPDFRLHPGIVLTLEPVVTLGSGQTKTLGDGWTLRTRDGSRTACEERTIAITPGGPRVLTGPGMVGSAGA